MSMFESVCSNQREAEKVGMQTLTGTPDDCRAIHSVLHAMEGRVTLSLWFKLGTKSRRSAFPARDNKGLE